MLILCGLRRVGFSPRLRLPRYYMDAQKHVQFLPCLLDKAANRASEITLLIPICYETEARLTCKASGRDAHVLYRAVIRDFKSWPHLCLTQLSTVVIPREFPPPSLGVTASTRVLISQPRTSMEPALQLSEPFDRSRRGCRHSLVLWLEATPEAVVEAVRKATLPAFSLAQERCPTVLAKMPKRVQFRKAQLSFCSHGRCPQLW